MCSMKTGCLARFAVLLASAALRVPRDEAVLADAAEKLGVGFQILDDVKNLTTGIPGKKRGDDITEGKKSLPVLIYLRDHPEKAGFAADCFKAAREGSAAQTEAFIVELEKAGVLEEARLRGEALINEAKKAFRELPPARTENESTSEGRRLLAGFTELLR